MDLKRLHSRSAGCRIAYLEGGRPGPLAVVFIHGVGNSGPLFFAECVDHPSLQGCRALAPDLPGFGYSDAPRAGFAYSIADFAAALWDLLDGLEVREAVLIGHSWGFAVGLLMAEQRPGRVACLVSGEGPMRLEELRLAPEILQTPYDAFASGMWPKLRAFLSGLPGRTGELVARATDLTTPWAWYHAFRAITEVIGGEGAFERFVGLSVPRAYLASEEMFRRRFAHLYAIAARGVPVVTVPGTTHALVTDTPAEFVQAAALAFAPRLAAQALAVAP